MNKDFLQHSPRSCVTYSAPSPTCQSSRGQLDSTARKVTQDRAEPTATRAWQARMGNEVTLDHAERRGKTDEMVLTEKRVLQVMKALSDPCQSTSGEGQNSGSSRPKRSGVRGLIYAARAVVGALPLLVASLGRSSTLAHYPPPLQRPHRLRLSSSKTECGCGRHGTTSQAG